MCFASLPLLGLVLSCLVALSSDVLGFAFGMICALLAAELIHFYGLITHNWLLFPIRAVEKAFLTENKIKIEIIPCIPDKPVLASLKSHHFTIPVFSFTVMIACVRSVFCW